MAIEPSLAGLCQATAKFPPSSAAIDAIDWPELMNELAMTPALSAAPFALNRLTRMRLFVVCQAITKRPSGNIAADGFLEVVAPSLARNSAPTRNPSAL